jgi:hypothetical protein
MISRPGIGGHFAAVVIATSALLWCDGTLAVETQAILLRGYLGLFSDGLDRLAQELRARGIKAEVRKHLYWTTTVSDILRERAAGKLGALILMGHSQGGNDAIEIARALEGTGHFSRHFWSCAIVGQPGLFRFFGSVWQGRTASDAPRSLGESSATILVHG